MVIKFDQPVGSHLDTKELEYVSALHQTSPQLRQDGSLVAVDIVAFLASRHGLQVQEDGDFMQKEILVDLAGDPEEDPKHVLDLRQVAALLTLPHLVKISAKDDNADMDKYFGKVLTAILKDLGYSDSEKPTLSVELVSAILETYGEFNVPRGVIQEMVDAAGGNGEPFDKDTFRSALVADTQLLGAQWEYTESTNWEDVFRLDEKAVMEKSKSLRANELKNSMNGVKRHHSMDEEMPDIDEEIKDKARKVWTLGAIDQTADNFRSQVFIILLWLSAILVYFLFLFQTAAPWRKLDPDSFSSTVGYAVANGVSTWCWIFIQLSILGTTFFLMSTLGMSIYDKRGVWPTGIKLFISMFFVGLVMVGGGITSFNAKLFVTSTVSADENSSVLWVVVIIGAALLVIQLSILILAVAPMSFLQYFTMINKWLTPSLIRKEGYSKRAAGFKTEQMLDNALAMHEDNAILAKSMRASSAAMRAQGNAMTNFQESSHVTDYVGGVGWAWKKYFDSTIFKQDGLWFHTRLMTCSTAQFLVMFGMLGAMVYGHGLIDKNIVNPPPKELSISKQLEKDYSIAWAAVVPNENVVELLDSINRTGTAFVPLRRVSMVDVREFGILNFGFLQMFTDTTQLGKRDEDGAWYYNLTGFYYFPVDVSDDMVEGLIEHEEPEDFPSILEQELMAVGLGIPEVVQQAHFTSILAQDPPFVTNWTIAHIYTDVIVSQFDTVTAALSRGLDSNSVMDVVQGLIAQAEEPNVFEAMIDSIEAPEAYAGLYVGGIVAFASCAMVFALFIPSFVSTVLMFRSGAIPSLRSERTFKVYRNSGDTVTMLFGMTLWGAVFSGAIPGILVGGVIFLAIWDQTANVFLGLLGQMFGIVTTLVFKILILIYVRRLIVSAFYRRQPGASNILYLVLEVWNVALGLGAMAGRAAKLFLIVAVSLGRLESPILAEKVGWLFCINLDGISATFRRDVLAHEAHRHPYIERLGMLYLLKLRFGRKFGTRAGGLWRLMYVSALMPWIRKYRATVRDMPDLEQLMLMEVPHKDDGNALEDESSKKEIEARNERVHRLQSARKLSTTHFGESSNGLNRGDGLLNEDILTLKAEVRRLKQANTELALANKQSCGEEGPL